ncbi:MAG: glycogen debranching protein GlgX [Treponema sp.]|nr:glycogen debranching protein GlgX [Treponema sp.]
MNVVRTQKGSPLELGAVVLPDGVNFSIYSKDATKVVLCLFEKEDDKKPAQEIELDPAVNKTGNIWHIFLEGLKPGALYLYRVDGPYNPPKGQRFSFGKFLFDPYAKAFTKGSVFLSYRNNHKKGSMDASKQDLSDFPKCVVIDDCDFDWEDDKPLNYPLEKTIIYETHLKGFTAGLSAATGSSDNDSGTYKGFARKIEYLKELGITSVELLPIFEFDENENPNTNPKTGKPLVNYWGYSTIGFFAPKTSYAFDKTPGGAVKEFKQLVKELHKAGIEVILDVVYNHTAEGNEHGLTFEFRGLQNNVYYSLPQNDMQYYNNFSGCGNSVNCNHPVTGQFILDSLRYWVMNMHVDGFRFDLASILTRGTSGNSWEVPPLTFAISQDPVLANTKIIAEPWDCAGLYQLGGFPAGDHNRWSEWNGRFRDDIRRFIRGDENTSTQAATRIAGNSDLYNHSGRSPLASINFVTAHDGFTLNDLVSYNSKHNEQNGEENRDGSDDNLSYNHGYEGDCSNPKIESIRIRKIKNFLLMLFVSQGVPMMLAGDEMRRTQHGNNNAYCQDNELSWIDWSLAEKNSELVRFTKNLIALRKTHPVFARTDFFKDTYEKGSVGEQEITWYNVNAKTPDWTKMDRFLAFKLSGEQSSVLKTEDNDFYIAANMDRFDLTITLPNPPAGKKWYLVADTSFASPEDIQVDGEEDELSEQRRYVLVSGSCVILMSK